MLPLYDAQTGCLGQIKGQTKVVSAAELLKIMERCHIKKSLVRIFPGDSIHDIYHSNDKLYKTCQKHANLVACPVVIPNSGSDLEVEEAQIERAIKQNAGALWLRFATDHWLHTDWACKPLTDQIAKVGMAVFISAHHLAMDHLAVFAKNNPTQRIIYSDVGYRDQRSLIPLMQNFRNIYAALGPKYTIHFGIETLVSAVGATRLIFGSGFPIAEPMGAVMQLLYAELPTHDKELIAFKNLEKLTGKTL